MHLTQIGWKFLLQVLHPFFGSISTLGHGMAIWNEYVPSSKSFLIQRLLHNQLPIEDNSIKGIMFIVSKCCHCLKNMKSADHLFFQYVHLWLDSGIGLVLA